MRGYDEWKLRTPPEYEWDRPEPQQDPGGCRLCGASGWAVYTIFGRYVGPGPLPEYCSRPNLHDVRCPDCGGSGEIICDDEEQDDAA